ncbi:transglutaminase-like domain-containing protein [Paenibacillus silvisoli]|uniref:transglutaminase-like domain-containing protein n=1 Tax=Paenibacillus silvisoli TaxID=3110539 RepID=UPI0028053403|nr:transglutaminase-like domain-containing protein [Paenibacillus silvisoli]
MRTFNRAAIKWFSADAYRKLSAVFSALIVYQWVRCLGDYWWEETFTIVNGILFAAVAANLLIPSKLLSGTVQLVTLVGLNAAYSGYTWVAYEGDKLSAAQWLDWLHAQYSQLTPFIWISLGVWAVFHSIVLLRHRRAYMMLAVALAILSLAAADSLFTPIHLWDEIAWLVFIGLGWLVASHFSRFKERHPENWAHLLEYPLSLFLPMLLIITLVMGAGLFVPAVRPVLTDPYTAWKEARGESIPNLVGDKAITVAATKSTASGQSGYSRDDNMLGGGFEFDYTPVMTVTTTKKSYWRGETKALYNGNGWEESAQEKKEKAQGEVTSKVPFQSRGVAETTKTEQVDQSITMLRDDKFPVLFGAGPISTVLTVNGKPTLPDLDWLPSSWELRLQKSSSDYPENYTLISQVPILDEAALRGGAAVTASADIDPMYLQVPETLPERVKTLAKNITSKSDTPYDKVNALISYLQLTFEYTNTPDTSKRISEDFVDSFLFEVREGYCDYFSTSLAVMARTLGIPTRWVKGYSPGSKPVDPDFERLRGMVTPEEASAEEAGTYTVRNADAHSWVEVYFNGYGWLPFEPTSGFAYPYALPKDAPEPETEPDLAVETDDVTAPAEDNGFQAQPWMFWTAASVLAAILGALSYRPLLRRFARYGGGSATVNERIVKDTNRLIRYCRKKGLDYNEYETVRETMSRWSGRLSSLQPQFREVQVAFEQAMYSSKAMTREDADRLALTMKHIREHLG